MRSLFLILSLISLLLVIVIPVCANDQYTIMLDPGHGAEESGATATYNGVRFVEKDLNNTLCLYMQDLLSGYQTQDGRSVSVKLSRTPDEGVVSIGERISRAKAYGADFVLSVHNNASSDGTKAYSGGMMLITSTHYQPENSKAPDIYALEEKIAHSMLNELTKLGQGRSADPLDREHTVNNNGIVRRTTAADPAPLYPNNDPEDYYGIVRIGLQAGIPSVIIEFAYIDNQADCERFLSSDESLHSLAQAGVDGLVKGLGLVKASGSVPHSITFFDLN